MPRPVFSDAGNLNPLTTSLGVVRHAGRGTIAWGELSDWEHFFIHLRPEAVLTSCCPRRCHWHAVGAIPIATGEVRRHHTATLIPALGQWWFAPRETSLSDRRHG